MLGLLKQAKHLANYVAYMQSPVVSNSLPELRLILFSQPEGRFSSSAMLFHNGIFKWILNADTVEQQLSRLRQLQSCLRHKLFSTQARPLRDFLSYYWLIWLVDRLCVDLIGQQTTNSNVNQFREAFHIITTERLYFVVLR